MPPTLTASEVRCSGNKVMSDCHTHHHHHHHHHHHGAMTGRRMVFSIGLTVAFVLVETAAGFFSHSLALLSDAGHNFADALALLLAWSALGAARRPANAARTFGYHRPGILPARATAWPLGS